METKVRLILLSLQQNIISLQSFSKMKVSSYISQNAVQKASRVILTWIMAEFHLAAFRVLVLGINLSDLLCSNTHDTILFSLPEKIFNMYVKCSVPNNTRMSYCIWGHFAVPNCGLRGGAGDGAGPSSAVNTRYVTSTELPRLHG